MLEKFREILEATSDIVGMADSDGRTLFVNQAGRKILGIGPDEDLSDFHIPEYHPKDMAKYINEVAVPAALRDGLWAGETSMLARDGRIIPTHQVLIAHRGSDGEVEYLSTIARDISDQKKIEQTLRDNEERLQDLFERSPDAVFVQDLEGNVLNANQAACDLHRMDRNELIGKNVVDLVPPERREEVARDYPKLAKGDQSLIDGMSYTAGGRRIPVEIRVSRLDYDQPLLLLHVRETGDRIEAEQELRESERRLRTIVDQAAVGVGLMETATGRFERINKKFCDMIGYSRDEITDRTFMDITHPDDLQEDLDNMKRLVAGEIREFSMEKRYFRRDGSIVWVNLTVSPTWEPGEDPDYHIAIVEDITERKRAEQELRESERRFRTIVDQAAVGVALMETATGRFERINKKFCDMIGYSIDEITNRTFMDITHPDDLQDDLDNMKRLVAGEIREFSMEKRYFHRDGSIVWVNLTVSSTWKPGEEPDDYHIAIVEDITERKRTENQLRFTQFAIDRCVDTAFWCRSDATFLYVNDAACNMFGYSREDMMQLAIFDLDMSVSQEDWSDHWQGIRNAGSIVLESRGCRRDGSRFPVELTIYHVEFDGQEMCCAFVKDITERKQAEQLSKATRFAVETVGESMFKVAWDGRFLDVNESACERLEYSREELLRLSVSDICPECTTDVWWHQRWQSIKERGQMLFETEHRSRSGKVFPVEISTTFVDFDGQEFCFAFARDISSRRKEEKSLKSQTHQLAAVHEAMSIFLESGDWQRASQRILKAALFETVSEYGFIGILEDGALRVYAHEGIQWHEAKGRELFESAVQEYDEKGYLQFNNFQNLFGHVITHKTVVISNDPPRDERSGGVPTGHPPLKHFLGVPIFRGQDVVGIIGVANRADGYSASDRSNIEILCGATGVLYDGYRRREREKSLEQQRRRLEYSAEIRQKMTDIAATERRKIGAELHDSLGQNLTGLAFMCQHLQRKLKQQSSDEAGYAQEMSDLTATTLSQVRRLVRGLYPIEQIEQTLATCLEELAIHTRIRFGVECQFEAQMDTAILDNVVATQLYYIAQETVNNAIKHSKASRIDLSLAVDASRLVLTVSDNGTGFDLITVEGDGMGLDVMMSRAKSIDAELKFESSPGKSTKVTCIIETQGE